MTEIPEHLRKRAEERRATNALRDDRTVEVPLHMLEDLRSRCGYSTLPIIQALIDLIPKPAYEPDILLVQEYAWIQGYSNEAARQELIDLHNVGLTVSFTDKKAP